MFFVKRYLLNLLKMYLPCSPKKLIFEKCPLMLSHRRQPGIFWGRGVFLEFGLFDKQLSTTRERKFRREKFSDFSPGNS